MNEPPPDDATASPASTPSPVTGGPRQAAMAFVLVTVALDMLALGIIVPVLPGLVVSFVHGNLEQGLKVLGWFGVVWAAMQFFFSPVLGVLSDRFGRRPVILASNFGLGLDYILMAVAPSLPWLFLGRLISGLTAGSVPTAFAYISDVTPHKDRAAAFGKVGAVFGLGFILGPVMGGVLGQINPRLPFWLAAVLSLTNACYGLFVLPESLPLERRSPWSLRRANPVGALVLLRAHPELSGLSVANLLCYLAHEAYPNIYVVYVGYRYHWTGREIGWTLGLAGVCGVIVQGFLIRPISARLGERRTLLTGLCFGAAGFLLYGLAARPWLFCLAIPIASLWGMANPQMQSIMSRRVSPTEQGRLQGALNALRGISGMTAPKMFTGVMALFIVDGWASKHGWQLPGAPFLMSCGFLCVALTLAWLVTRKSTDAGVPPQPGYLQPPPEDAPPSGFTPETA